MIGETAERRRGVALGDAAIGEHLLLVGRRLPAGDIGGGDDLARRIGDRLEAEMIERLAPRGGRVVALKPKEYDLLWHFVCNPGRVYTREQLLAQVGRGTTQRERYIKSIIEPRLRKWRLVPATNGTRMGSPADCEDRPKHNSLPFSPLHDASPAAFSDHRLGSLWATGMTS